MTSSKHIELCNHHHNPILKHFHHPKKKLHAQFPALLIPTLTPRQPLIYFLSLQIYFFLTFPLNRIITYVISCVWFLPLNRMFWKFSYAVVCINTPLLFSVQQYSSAWIDHFLFIYLSIDDGYLDCFHLLVNMNNAANGHLYTNLCVDI